MQGFAVQAHRFLKVFQHFWEKNFSVSLRVLGGRSGGAKSEQKLSFNRNC